MRSSGASHRGGGGGRGGRGRASGTGDRRRRSGRTAGDTEPVQDIASLLWHGVADTLGENGLDVGAVRRAGVAGERVVGDVGDGSLGDVEDVGPLLDLLPEILGVESGVTV